MKHMKVIAAFLSGISLISLAACNTEIKIVNDNESSAQTTATAYVQPTTDAYTTAAAPETTAVSSAAESTTAVTPAVPTTAAPASEATTAAAPTGYTNEQILKVLSDAVNKTKGYTGSITVDHQESFNIVEPVVNVGSSATAGSLATKAVNFVKDLVLKPSEETYQFSGGVATTSEKEQTQLLLPKAAAFTLPLAGVASAKTETVNGLTHITMTLASESVHSLSDVPAYNASSIGYLDLDGTFNIIKISKVDITYPGSTIDAYIRADGYVQSITYVINMKAYTEASGMGISGSAQFSGSQTEVWEINW